MMSVGNDLQIVHTYQNCSKLERLCLLSPGQLYRYKKECVEIQLVQSDPGLNYLDLQMESQIPKCHLHLPCPSQEGS